MTNSVYPDQMASSEKNTIRSHLNGIYTVFKGNASPGSAEDDFSPDKLHPLVLNNEH